MSSKSSSSIMAGTMRSISGPGRWTRTDLSLPISEVTLRVMQALRGRADSTGGAGVSGNPGAVPNVAKSRAEKGLGRLPLHALGKVGRRVEPSPVDEHEDVDGVVLGHARRSVRIAVDEPAMAGGHGDAAPQPHGTDFVAALDDLGPGREPIEELLPRRDFAARV